MKTTPPTACQGIPGTEGAKRVLVRSLKMQFAAKTGATTCHELKRTYKVPCEQAIATAADLLQQHIKGTLLES